MDANDYQDACLRTKIKDFDLVCGALGLNNNSSEVGDIIKNALYQNHRVDHDKLIDALGDTAWYLATLSNYFGFSLNGVFNTNIKKLQEWYPNGAYFDL